MKALAKVLLLVSLAWCGAARAQEPFNQYVQNLPPASSLTGSNLLYVLQGTTSASASLSQIEGALTFTQAGTGAVQRLLDGKIKDGSASVSDFGGDCTGATGSDAAISAALAAGSTVIIPVGCTVKTTTSLTIAQSKTVLMACGSSLTPAAGTTLTFQGRVYIIGNCQVFGTGHNAPAAPSSGVVVGVLDVRPEMFGAWNDNVHDDSLATQAAINSAVYTGPSDYQGAHIQFSCGAGVFIGTAAGPNGLSVSLPQNRLVDIGGCGFALNSGGIIVHDAAQAINGLALSSSGGVNFHIHDLLIQTTTAGTGACGISLTNINTNSAAIVSNVIERVQIGTNFPTLAVGFGTGGICETDVLEVGLRDLTIYLPNAGSGANGILVTTDIHGGSGDAGWDHLTIANCTSGAPCIANRPIYLTTTTGTCTAPVNCWTQGIHITHSFLYPYVATNALTLFARGTQLIADIWLDGVQFDDLRAVNGQVIYTPTDSGAEIDNLEVVHSYFTGGSGSQGTAVYYDGGSGGGHTNYLNFTNNYVNLGSMCGNGTSASAISINAGKNHRIIGNSFVMACATVSPNGDINIGQGTQVVTGSIVADNVSNCAAVGSTTVCPGASQFMIATGANAKGVTVYNNNCAYGATSTATGCGVFNASGVTSHSNNCIQNAGNTAMVCN